MLFAYLGVLAVSVAFYAASRGRASALAGDRTAALHSRPVYHGLLALLASLLVGWTVLVVANWAWLEVNDRALQAQIEAAALDKRQIERQLLLSDAKSIAQGRVASADDDLRREIARSFERRDTLRVWTVVGAALVFSGIAGFLPFRAVSRDFRARNASERIIRGILVAMATIAILTTVGIVLSLIFRRWAGESTSSFSARNGHR